MSDEPAEFICPECGSKDAGDTLLVTAVPHEDDPWSSILKTITCSHCRSSIPAHLAERWDGLSLADAQSEWKENYSDSQPLPKPVRAPKKPYQDDPSTGGLYY